VFLVLAVLLLIFLPSPWNAVGTLAALGLFVLEVVYWQRRMRSRRVQTGVENLVGAIGEVTKPLSPSGQIRVLGELWEAHSTTRLARGARVRVVDVRNLTLEVEPVTDTSGSGARVGGTAALLVAAVLALAGCGGDGGSSASEDYANDVCSNVSTWVTDVQGAVQNLTDQGLSISREDIQTTYDEVKDSTDTMANDLERLGPPETEEGQQAKSELDDLATELRQQLDVIKEAIDSGGGLASIAATVSTAVSTAANAVNTTYQNLQGLNPPGELSDAFQDSDECKSLEDQIGNLRSGGR
jgi:membrane protein implicated in regulation of membrane protease activity